jgi:hypothetical protein
MRNIRQGYLSAYRERWDDLLQPPGEIPYWLPQSFSDWVKDVGLPPGHPGVVRPSDGSRA